METIWFGTVIATALIGVAASWWTYERGWRDCERRMSAIAQARDEVMRAMLRGGAR